MLRITTIEQAEEVIIKLEGKLSGPWAEEFSGHWQKFRNTLGTRKVAVDLSGLTFVDLNGKKLLCSISCEGAQLVGSGLMPKAWVEEICGEGSGEKSPKGIDLSKQKTAHLIVLLALALLPAAATRAQDAATLRLTLRDAVAAALKENPQVQIAALNFAESQQDKTIARSALLPQAGLEVLDHATRFNLYAEFGSRFPGIPQHAGPFQFFQAGPSVTMPLLDLTLWRRWQASHEGVRASQADDATVHEQIVLLVVSQYLSGMRANAAVKAAQSRADLAKALYDQAGDLQKHGVGTGIDTLRANVELQNEKQRLLEAQTQQKVALYGLARLLNLDPHRDIELADSPGFYETPEIDETQSIEQAYGARPEMTTLIARVQAAEIARRGASDSRLPTLNFYGTWGEQGLSATGAIPAYIYQVTVDVPLFTGGRIRADIAKESIEIKKLNAQEADLRNQIALEVKTSAAQIDAARHEVDVANLGLNLAHEEVSQARDRFQAGVANNIEVVTAQDALARANDNQIEALYRYNQSRADFARAIGQIENLYSK